VLRGLQKQGVVVARAWEQGTGGGGGIPPCSSFALRLLAPEGGSQPLSELPFFAPYLASEGLLPRQGYSDSPPPLRGVSEAKYDESLSRLSLAIAPLLVSKRCQILQFCGGRGLSDPL